jgi:hypothetical protein
MQPLKFKKPILIIPPSLHPKIHCHRLLYIDTQLNAITGDITCAMSFHLFVRNGCNVMAVAVAHLVRCATSLPFYPCHQTDITYSITTHSSETRILLWNFSLGRKCILNWPHLYIQHRKEVPEQCQDFL